MAWCEENAVDYIFGLARNERLVKAIRRQLARPAAGRRNEAPARRFKILSGRHWTAGASAPRDCQSRVDARRSQSALPRHLAQLDRRCALPLRGPLLRARRHGEPHQGVPDRHVRRPHQRRQHARQSAALVVCGIRLRADLRAAPHRARRHAMAVATCGTIRLKLLKIGALVTPVSGASRSRWPRRVPTRTSSASPPKLCEAPRCKPAFGHETA